MISDKQKLDDAWLGIDVDEKLLFNPMDFITEARTKISFGKNSLVNDETGVFLFRL